MRSPSCAGASYGSRGARSWPTAPPRETLERYIRAAGGSGTRRALRREPGSDAQVAEVALTDAHGAAVESLMRGQAFGVTAALEVARPLDGLDVAFWVMNHEGLRIVDERLSDGAGRAAPLGVPGAHDVRLDLPGLLPAGEYVVGLWLGTDERDYYNSEVVEVRVVPRPEDPQEFTQRRRAVAPGARWSSRVRDAAG
jgi:hypothetical protein